MSDCVFTLAHESNGDMPSQRNCLVSSFYCNWISSRNISFLYGGLSPDDAKKYNWIFLSLFPDRLKQQYCISLSLQTPWCLTQDRLLVMEWSNVSMEKSSSHCNLPPGEIGKSISMKRSKVRMRPSTRKLEIVFRSISGSKRFPEGKRCHGTPAVC